MSDGFKFDDVFKSISDASQEAFNAVSSAATVVADTTVNLASGAANVAQETFNTVASVVGAATETTMNFVSETTKINESIPILIKIVEGDVPSYYFDGYLKSPTITKNVE